MKKIISFLLAVALIAAAPASTFGEHVFQTGNVYYSDDFESYTPTPNQGDDIGASELKAVGNITVYTGSGTRDANGNYARITSIVEDSAANRYLRVVNTTFKFRNPDSSLIQSFCEAGGYNSFKIEFDTMLETIPAQGVGFQYRFVTGHRLYLLFTSDAKLKYALTNNSSPSAYTELDGVTVNPGEWNKLQIKFEDKKMRVSFADKMFINGNGAIATLANAQFADNGFFFESTNDGTAFCVDNVNLEAYNYVSPIIYSDDFESYTPTPNQGDDIGASELKAVGNITVYTGSGTRDANGNYARITSIVEDSAANRYLRVVNTTFKFRNPDSSLIQSFCEAGGYNSFKIEFDTMLETIPAQGVGFQYRFVTGHRLYLLFTSDAKLKYALTNNSSPSAYTELDGVTVNPGEWNKLQIKFEDKKMRVSFADKMFINGNGAIATLANAQFADNGFFFESTNDGTAFCVDNVNLEAYNYVSPILYDEDFESYSTEIGTGKAEKEINGANGGLLRCEAAGQPDNYTGAYSRRAEVVLDDTWQSKYLRLINSAADLNTAWINESLSSNSFDSFILEFDARIERNISENSQIRYITSAGHVETYFFTDGTVRFGDGTTNILESILIENVNACEFNRFALVCTGGVFREYINNTLITERAVRTADDEMLELVKFINYRTVNGLSVDNICIRGFNAADVSHDITAAVKNGEEALTAENLVNGAAIEFTVSYDARAYGALVSYIAVYDKESKELVALNKGVTEKTNSFGAGMQTAAITIPETGKYIVRPFVWKGSMMPVSSIDSVAMN